MTKDTKSRFDALVRMGCVVCRVFHGERSEPHIHHLLGIKYRGMGMKARDEHTIPLCPTHHQNGTKIHPSVHAHRKAFTEKYGTQEELLKITDDLIDTGI